MVNLNLWIGIALCVLGFLSLLLSFVIAAKKYVFTSQLTLKVAGAQGSEPDLLKVFLELLKEILKAPPASAFLVSGLLLVAGGGYVLHFKPF